MENFKKLTKKPLFLPMGRKSVLVSRVSIEAQPQKLQFFFSGLIILFSMQYIEQ